MADGRGNYGEAPPAAGGTAKDPKARLRDEGGQSAGRPGEAELLEKPERESNRGQPVATTPASPDRSSK